MWTRSSARSAGGCHCARGVTVSAIESTIHSRCVRGASPLTGLKRTTSHRSGTPRNRGGLDSWASALASASGSAQCTWMPGSSLPLAAKGASPSIGTFVAAPTTRAATSIGMDFVGLGIGAPQSVPGWKSACGANFRANVRPLRKGTSRLGGGVFDPWVSAVDCVNTWT